MNTNNPLKAFFRQPAIYVRLPSNGQWYPDGTLDFKENNEYPVYPMTAIDEIHYRTPDALFNGEAVVSVIQSCIPNIKDAWAIPQVDLDTILVAIRIASYGHNMEFNTTCPACNHEESRSLDLRTVIDVLKPVNYGKTLKFGDLELFFKPLTYKNITDTNKLQYEEQRLIQQMPTVTAENAAEAVKFDYGKVLDQLAALTVSSLSQSIAVIKTNDTAVVEPEYIAEFLTNCDRRMFKEISEYIIENKKSSEIQPLQIQCSECNHEYTQPFTLNMTSFFSDAS